ncbi:Alpha-mannosidase 2x, variant 2 [Basidiobolus ranarum]
MTRTVVRTGQLEFVSGSWVMHDEAMPTAEAMLINMEMGLDWLWRSFQVRPRIGWQIDPFGHADVTPTLFRQFGFDTMVMSRIPNSLHQGLASNRSLQFHWHSSDPHLADLPPLLTHVLHRHYGLPNSRFDFDRDANTCSSQAEVAQLYQLLLDNALEGALDSYPLTGHVMVLMGDDFRYVFAERWFPCLDKIVEYAQSKETETNIRVKYSTASDYFSSVTPFYTDIHSGTSKEKQTLAEEKKSDVNNPTTSLTGVDRSISSSHETRHQLTHYFGDFFPYDDGWIENWWSGYYATRPVIKGAIRQVERGIHHAQKLIALTKLSLLLSPTSSLSPPAKNLSESATLADISLQRQQHQLKTIEDYEVKLLNEAKRELSITHHHDAITGTCTQPTCDDYIVRLKHAQSLTQSISESVLNALFNNMTTLPIESELKIQPGSESTFDGFGAEYHVQGGSERIIQLNEKECNTSSCNVTVLISNAALEWSVFELASVETWTSNIRVIDLKTNQPVHPIQINQNIKLDAKPRDSDKMTQEAGDRPPYTVMWFTRISAFGQALYRLESVKNEDIDRVFSPVPVNLKTDSVILGPLSPSADSDIPSIELTQPDGYALQFDITSPSPSSDDASSSQEHRKQTWSFLLELRQYLITSYQPSGAYIFRSFVLQFAWVWLVTFIGLAGGVVVGYVCYRFVIPSPRQAPLGAIFGRFFYRLYCRIVSNNKSNGSFELLETNDDYDIEHGVEEKAIRDIQRVRKIFICCWNWVMDWPLPIFLGWVIGSSVVTFTELRLSDAFIIELANGERNPSTLLVVIFVIALLVVVTRWRPGSLLLFLLTASLGLMHQLCFQPTEQARRFALSANPLVVYDDVGDTVVNSFSTLIQGPLCSTFLYQLSSLNRMEISYCYPSPNHGASSLNRKDIGNMLRVQYTIASDSDREIVTRYTPLRTSASGTFTGTNTCRFETLEAPSGLPLIREYSHWRTIPGNYYPIVHGFRTLNAFNEDPISSHIQSKSENKASDKSKSSLKSRVHDMSVFTTQAMGAACLPATDTVEVMLHRRLMSDDQRGLMDINNDRSTAVIDHFIPLASTLSRKPDEVYESTDDWMRENAQINAPVQLFQITGAQNQTILNNLFNNAKSLETIKSTMPDDSIHILSLRLTRSPSDPTSITTDISPQRIRLHVRLIGIRPQPLSTSVSQVWELILSNSFVRHDSHNEVKWKAFEVLDLSGVERDGSYEEELREVEVLSILPGQISMVRFEWTM